MTQIRLPGLASTALILGLAAVPLAAQTVPDVPVAAVDSIFASFDDTRSPGCAVGVSLHGKSVLERAYGMADLEHRVPNGPETIFEPGSVAKQFTTTAVILLAMEGILSLDDDIRTYVPELPDYGETITIRHLMNHTSGLRDWGSLADIEGWPRSRRAHTHNHVLDILSRQQELNYTPGDYYSYTNSGFNLQAILVSRVSGMPFAEFSRERIFEPLGMKRTEWRDDFTRIVPDRSVAYERDPEEGWKMLMPFENVHGNGGLLTTVGDLLRFTHNLQTGAMWGPEYLEEMHRQGVLNSGGSIEYASGLRVRTYKGLREVHHSGSTAGYRGHLARFPDQDLAVAVMCNRTDGDAGGHLHRVADLYLAGALGTEPGAPGNAVAPDPVETKRLAGRYRDTRTGRPIRISVHQHGLQLEGEVLFALSSGGYGSADGETTLTVGDMAMVDGRPAAILDRRAQPGVRIEPVPDYDPSPEELAAFAGTYVSDEAEATYVIEADAAGLSLVDRWGGERSLGPVYPDAFGTRGRTLIFQRDAAGAVTGLRWSESRVWSLAFRRTGG